MEDSLEKDFNGIDLCLIGASGVGKTVLMAKLAKELSVLSELPVIIRFCGMSKGSANGLELVTSICRQILFIFDRLGELSSLSTSYTELVEYFHRLLADYAMILVIDSIDQLSDENLARSNITS